MARHKPYSAGLLTLDIFLTLFTGGFWIVVFAFREYRNHNR